MNEPSDPDRNADPAKDIEAFSLVVMDYARTAANAGTIAAAYIPEALLLAAVELAASHDSNPEHVADWLAGVSERLREHVAPRPPIA